MPSTAVYSRVKVSAAALATAAIASLEIGGSCEATGGRQRIGHNPDPVAVVAGSSSEGSAFFCGRENGEAGPGDGGPEGESREGWGVYWREAVEQVGSKICLQEEVASVQGKKSRKKKNRKKSGASASADRGGRNGEREEIDLQWVGPAPWDKAVGGDGVPKFLCDTMVRGQRGVRLQAVCSPLMCAWHRLMTSSSSSSCCDDVIVLLVSLNPDRGAGSPAAVCGDGHGVPDREEQ